MISGPFAPNTRAKALQQNVPVEISKSLKIRAGCRQDWRSSLAARHSCTRAYHLCNTVLSLIPDDLIDIKRGKMVSLFDRLERFFDNPGPESPHL